MKKVNKMFSYRKWIPFWGLFADQHKEIEKVIEEYNKDGWHVVQFDWTSDNFNLFRCIKIILITTTTLGFFVYWAGAIIIFEKETP